MRGATNINFLLFSVQIISIHAPHAGSDLSEQELTKLEQFQSTLPMRGATLID